MISKGVQNYFFLHDGIQDIGKFGETIQGMLYNGNADVDIHEVRIIHKFSTVNSKIYQLNGLEYTWRFTAIFIYRR